ncbi:MAG: hypothetical protein U0175_05390 [Caldilineaceae bacterium]
MIQSKEEALAIMHDLYRNTWEREEAIHYLRKQTLNEHEIEALVEQLRDTAAGVRWAAGSALAAAGQIAIVPLLRALTGSNVNSLLLASAHHVLHDTIDVDARKQAEPLLDAIRGPGADVAAMTEAAHWLSRLEAAKV